MPTGTTTRSTEVGNTEAETGKRRRERKEEGKLKKRQRIEESGGVRPRPSRPNNGGEVAKKKTSNATQRQRMHRFGQVMEQVPCRNRPRFSTTSIALPGSVLSNCQTRELKTHLVGQIARACTLYHVDEIVVFDDKLSKTSTNQKEDEGDPCCAFLARVLQYCECPQYLRRSFFPRHPDLQFAGLLPPIDAPHHVRAEDCCPFREGVVLESKDPNAKLSLVNCGIPSRPVEIDRLLPAGIRCTVQIDPKDYGRPGKKLTGKVVSPSTPREENGTYWGFTTRIATSIHKVFDESPFPGGYDMKIGTSERGDVSVDDRDFSIPKFNHSLIVFGGVAGIEECVDADETTRLPGSQTKSLFELWVNVCPFQGSRTIRTEEAVLITLAKLSSHMSANEDEQLSLAKGSSTKKKQANTQEKPKQSAGLDFSDDVVSEESSDTDKDHDTDSD